MRLKSYFAGNVGSALSLARQELGPEAMLVHSRKTPPESRHLGDFEVVVALEGGSAGGFSGAEPAENGGALASEVAELRRQVERMALSVARSSYLAMPKSVASPELAEMYSLLLACEVDAELAHDIVSRMRASGAVGDPGRLRNVLAAELRSRFEVDSRLGRNGQTPKVVALAGPSGSGKTTTLVKLAALYGLSARRPTQLISMDCYRVAAADQLRAYAAILGVGFQALETTAALAQALEEHKHKELILIDTPGHGCRDLDNARELARFLSTHPGIDTHLVLTASTKSADLSRVVDRFEIFGPRKLIFTKLDETESFGPILSEAARTGKPISFLAGGQTVPEDLEAATKDRVVELILNGKAGPLT